MADLYTSQVHLKRLLAGQAAPAFTPASADVVKVLDPAFFPGMGALNEDKRGRLQCPVRDCGEWYGNLAQHLSHAHRTIGGANAVRIALEIPRRAPLMSAVFKRRFKERFVGVDMTARFRGRSNAGALKHATEGDRMRMRSAAARTAHSMAQRNWADTCPAQLRSKIEALAAKIGRSPTTRDFAAEYGDSARSMVMNVFGSWNNAVSLAGLTPANTRRCQTEKDTVCRALLEWHRQHGDLPSVPETQKPERTPKIPSYATIMRACEVDTWDAAMRTVAESCNLKTDRYQMDFRRRA